MSYGWPIEPFDRQHAVRGFFCDPRISDGQHSFHFGIDVAAPDGTAVYAVAAGTVHVDDAHNVAVLGIDDEHAYWHIVPTVRAGQEVRKHALLGHVARGWGHVHLAERKGGHYWNPLRRNALTPFEDYGAPVVDRVAVERAGSALDPVTLAGVVDLVAEAHDNPPISAPPPWSGLPVTPALVRWRLLRSGTEVFPWKIAADFRGTMIPNTRFAAVYAPGTQQNHANTPGRYRFWLARGWDTRTRRDGRYELEVEASDTRGNRSRRRLDLVLVNGGL
jgi:Peptidase family M23